MEGERPPGRPRTQIAPPAVSAGLAAVASTSEAAVEAAPFSPPVSRCPRPLPSPPATPRPSLLGRLGGLSSRVDTCFTCAATAGAAGARVAAAPDCAC